VQLGGLGNQVSETYRLGSVDQLIPSTESLASCPASTEAESYWRLARSKMLKMGGGKKDAEKK